MEKYKPGQVANLLFRKNKPQKSITNNPLSKLFFSNEASSKGTRPKDPGIRPEKRKRQGFAPEAKKQKIIAVQDENVSSATTQMAAKKTKSKKKQNNRTVQGTSVEKKIAKPQTESSRSSSPQKDKKNKDRNQSVSPRKRKSESGQSEEDETVKRPRRDRQRDKTADSRTVFVGNCPLSADKKTLRQLFQKYGKIENIRFRCAPPGDPTLPRRVIAITKNFHEQCSSYVGYIVFQEEGAAKEALEMNGHVLEEHHLRVDIAASSKKHDKKRSVFIGNLPFDVQEEEVRSHFSDCGEIVNIRIIRDRQTSLGKGICYVQFESKDSVTLALKLKDSDFKGRKLRVEVCTSKVKRKETAAKSTKNPKLTSKPKAKKPSFAPSNTSSSSFRNVLKLKKEKRLRKIKKKKENAKKSDGLSAIFGDAPKPVKKPKAKKPKPGGKGKQFLGKLKSKSYSSKQKFGSKGKTGKRHS